MAGRYAVDINGMTGVIITKLDVLDGLETVRVGTAYDLDNDWLELAPKQGKAEVPGYDDLLHTLELYRALRTRNTGASSSSEPIENNVSAMRATPGVRTMTSGRGRNRRTESYANPGRGGNRAAARPPRPPRTAPVSGHIPPGAPRRCRRRPGSLPSALP